MKVGEKTILASMAAGHLIGRKSEMAALFAHTRSAGKLNVTSFPGGGVSEVLRQTYDKLFAEQGEVIPFYFEFQRNETEDLGKRFARTFLEQTLAFHRNDTSLIGSLMDLSELAALTLPSDGDWGTRLTPIGSDIVESAYFSAPARAAANGLRIFAMIDGIHELAFVDDGVRILREIERSLSHKNISYVFGSRRRSKLIDPRKKTLVLEPLSLSDADHLAETLSAELSIGSTDQTRDLLGVMLRGDPSKIKTIFNAAMTAKTDLSDFRKVCLIYANEILGGSIGLDLDEALARAATTTVLRRRLIEILADARNTATGSLVEVWQSHSGLTEKEFARTVEILDLEEIIQTNGRTITKSDDLAVSDWLYTRHALEIKQRPEAAVKAELLAESLKRAPGLMTGLYRSSSALGLADVLARFDCQDVPAALFDYGIFRKEYKGRPHKEIVEELSGDISRISLPQFIHVEKAAAFDGSVTTFVDDERSVVATGFAEGKYTDDDQIVWLAAEIDSKLEATAELTNTWLDRLDSLAVNAGLGRHRVWLISPEGFDDAAIGLLREHNAYGSSRQQAILLNRFLDPSQSEAESPSDQYEVVVPMGEDTELVAAQTVEEIARRHHFSQKAINQIKTALVEACINASEHSLSPDRKIYQEISVGSDRIDITVSNRGLRLTDVKVAETDALGGRRGWGLSLIKGLMDEVTIEQVDDGTRIKMTKFRR